MVHRPPSRDRLFDGRYRFVRTVGQGGMATVWLAEDETLGRKVALKVLADRYAEDDQFIERFRREAQSAAGLNHPNIVAIYDRGEAEGTYYIAMEYLAGPTLKDVIQRDGPFPAERAIGYALQVLQALGFAHRHGVVHRDIKPHNIMVTSDDRLKVTDFGIARAGASQMTEVGSIIGTAQYLSPEQARGQVVRPPADLYSLGVVLYEMLTGRVPFEGESAVAIAMQHVSDPPIPPSHFNPAVPAALEQVVLRALAKDSTLRYQSAEEMAADLERVRRGVRPAVETQQLTQLLAAKAEATRVAPPPPDGTRVWDGPLVDDRRSRGGPPPVAAPPRRRPVWPWALVLLLLCAAAAIGAIALLGTGSDNDTPTTSTVTKPTTATVPDVTGLSFTAARKQLKARGLGARQHNVRSNDPVGNVVADGMKPAAGQLVKRGTVVELKVSKGLDEVDIADVTGQTLDTATQTLKTQGFKVDTTFVDSNDPRNQVTAQDPTGSAVKGSTVTLSVSKGPPQVAVPDVSGETQAAATADLESKGFQAGTISTAASDSVAEGTVVSTNPASDSQADQGSTVDIVLSSGPAKVPVPDETGQTEDAASTDLTTQGFVPQASSIAVDTQDQDGLVQTQFPTGGARAKPGSKVILRIGSYTGGDTGTTPTTP